MAKQKKKPTTGAIVPERKNPRTAPQIDDLPKSEFRWKVSNEHTDLTHDDWGWHNLTIDQFFDVLIARLHDLDGMTWSEIDARKHCHQWKYDDLDPVAKRAVNSATDLDIGTLYQIDIDKMGRIIGVRDRHTFYLKWYDPNHKFYKTRKKLSSR